jgi:succinate dehydrogenase / fumarate reductase, cytochrome b subunit
LYLLLHMWVLGSANSGPEAFSRRLSAVQLPIFHVLEIGLIGIIFYHMFNGIAITIVDLFGLSRKHKPYVIAGACLFLAFTIFAAALILPRLAAHS